MKTVSDQTSGWLKKYYGLIDTNQQEEFMEYFSEDAIFRFANTEPIIGREAIHSALAELLNSINGIRHDIKAVWETEDGVVIYECDVTYIRKDNKEVVVKGAVVSKVENGLFKEQRLYVDVSPVFA